MNDSEWLRLRLELTEDTPQCVAFTVEFVNSTRVAKMLRFGGSEEEAARRGLRIHAGSAVLEPVEYRLVNRQARDLPEITVQGGAGYRFNLAGKWDSRILRFGRTGYRLDAGTYFVSFRYHDVESNLITWNVK